MVFNRPSDVLDQAFPKQTPHGCQKPGLVRRGQVVRKGSPVVSDHLDEVVDLIVRQRTRAPARSGAGN